VLAFSDSQSAKWGKEIDGTRVLPPQDAAREFGRTATFVVTVSAKGGDFLPLRRRLLDLGCAGVVPYRSLFWKYPDDCPPHLVADRPCRILQEKKEIRAVLDLLSDDTSRREYVGQLRWRLLQDFGALPAPSGEEQYFPPDIITLRPGEVFVDCGAYDGDTLRPFLRRCPGFARVLALEPDPANFARLTGFIGGLPADMRKRLSARMVCVGEKRGKVRFAAGGGETSKVTVRGETTVECETLDEICSGDGPSYVKMDIEGAELDALRGAERLLRQSEAMWAVCVYHKPEHLWQLPLFISEHSQGHRFFLRKYAGEIWETVCYAVPESRLTNTEAGASV
jgi:FkbM family methyltransferase